MAYYFDLLIHMNKTFCQNMECYYSHVPIPEFAIHSIERKHIPNWKSHHFSDLISAPFFVRN